MDDLISLIMEKYRVITYLMSINLFKSLYIYIYIYKLNNFDLIF